MTDDSTIDDVFRRGAQTLAGISPAGASPPWETFADVAPALGRQTALAFGSVISRPDLDLRTRELLTVAMLAALGGCDPQVTFHVGGALRAGATAPEIAEVLNQVGVYAGIPRALNAAAAARPAFAEAGADPGEPAARTVALDFLKESEFTVEDVLPHGRTVLVRATRGDPARRVVLELAVDGGEVTGLVVFAG